MPDSSRHHSRSSGKRRHRSFIDRLLGRKRHSRHHTSSFPGINLPQDHDPRKKVRQTEEVKPAQPFMDEDTGLKDFSDSRFEKLEEFSDSSAHRSSSKKPSLAEAIRFYFRRRALRREERQKNRMKDKLRRKHQKEYRKQEMGPSVAERLAKLREEGAAEEKKIPLLDQRSPFFRNMTIVVNSVAIFIATYILVYLFYWITSLLVASWYGIDSILYYYDLKFNDHSTLWNRFNILLVTGIPPFLCLFLGLFLIRIVFRHQRFAGLQKLFILWTSFHLFNHFFGAFPSGIITSEGFGYVAAWMYMNTAFKFMFAIISLFILGVIGYLSAQYVLETSDSQHRIKPENRTAFFFIQLALPWLIGTVIMLLVRTPKGFEYPYETLMFFSMAFMVIPPFFNPKVKPKLNMLRIKKKRSINLGYLFMMIALLAFLRIMLGIGLHFLIEINISISPATA